MSKFQSTVSVVAALASIFGAATAGWKLAQTNSDVPPSSLDQKIEQLEQKIEQTTISQPIQTIEEVEPSINQEQQIQTEQKPVIEQKPVVVQQPQPVAPVPVAPPAPQQQ